MKVVRKLPEKSLPPDFVITLATPPEKRPYSAEIAAVEVLVSSIASSMKSSVDWLRSVSFETTPLIRITSYNVCYTKLLRGRWRSGRPCERRSPRASSR